MTKRKTSMYLFGLVVLASFIMMGCEGNQGPQGPQGPEGPAGPLPEGAELSCTDCHNETSLITGKQTQWRESRHGTGTAYLRGTSSSCAGCHSGNAFAERVDAGLDPDELTEGDPNPTRQDCRACHRIHNTYTMADLAVRTTDPVDFYAVTGSTYDGGLGNLCANCHQPRRTIPAAVGGVISGITTHWGPHHGGQGSMLLGVAGAGNVQGSPSTHYQIVGNTCVHCHMGDGRDHHYEPDVDNCQQCHPGAEDFDVNGVQTDVQAKITQLGDRLVALGLINENTEDGHPIVTEAPEDQAIALWNWIYVAHEDKSLGVHNPAYTKALLDSSLALVP